ncbi:MAG: HAMP domain-containing sensor histidine kinase [Dehalococcoidia bacterium]|nr:HAMP domain-containing sensor histidine kinase [Dehalococcoidia bacterium]
MTSGLRGRTIVAVVFVVAIGFIAAAIALTEAGVHAGDMALPLLLAALATAAGAAFTLSLTLHIPLRTVEWLRSAVADMAGGADARRVPDFDRTELGNLASTFNEMARATETAFRDVEAERHRFIAVIDSISNGIIALDTDFHVRYLNPAAEEMLAVHADNALGKPFLYTLRDPDIHERLLTVRRRHQREAMATRLGPHGRDLQTLLMPLLDAGDWAFLVVLTDLTELHRLETVRREFVSNVSHELRTPLAALRAATETLQGGAASDPQAAGYFYGRIIDEVERMTNLVDELLTLSRAESPPGSIATLGRVDLGTVAKITVERLHPQAERKGLALRAQSGSAPALIIGDPEQIQRALANLVHNAIKFTSAGEVVVTAEVTGDRAILSIRDTGIGIRNEEQSRVFERFYKTDRSRSSEGSGLGLAIVKHIIQAHNGEVTLNSEPGHGSTFRCSFPAVSAVSAEL